MFKVGLTGGIASGKTTVCNLFIEYGITVVDADIIARQLVEKDQPCLTEIEQAFGSNYLSKDGELNRSLLRQLIFNDASAKKTLENILHPNIRQQMLEQSAKADSPYVIWCVPLLFESNMQDIMDRILVINTTRQNQFERLCLRDNIDPNLANKMLNAQASNEHRLLLADDIIDNNSDDHESLAEKVKNLHNQYLNLVISPK